MIVSRVPAHSYRILGESVMEQEVRKAHPRESFAGWKPEGCDRIAIVLQGGGALGAYQAGSSPA